jgi:HK97 family phage major capsid protein
MAEAALAARARLITELRSVAEDVTLTEADKQLRTERLEADIAAKLDEAEDLITRGEREAEVGALFRKAGIGDRGDTGTVSAVRDGVPLQRSQNLAPAWSASQAEDFGDYLRSLVFGQAEQRAMSEGTSSLGGFLTPTLYSNSVLDLARNKTRVIQAGAELVPVGSDDYRYAKVLTDPAPGWRNEAAAIAVDDMTLSEIQFQPKSLAVLVKASWELMADASMLGDTLYKSLAGAFATKLDYAALYGSGVAPEPLGIKGTGGVTITPVSTNGGPVQWSQISNTVAAIKGANYDNVSVLLSDRTENYLAQRTASGSGEYVLPPYYVADVPRLTTSQIPNNLVVGTSGATTSDLFIGDFSQSGFGIRNQFEIRPLRERFADTGQVGFVGWLRADYQAYRSNAFQCITGATAA